VLFQNNVEQNHLEDRIMIVSKAASDRAGRTAFDLGPADQTGWGGFSTNSATATVVPTVRLDEELPDAKIDVLKIDTEGADTLVLLGCERLLRNRRIQIIYFEQNEPRMKALGVTANTAQSFLHGPVTTAARSDRIGPNGSPIPDNSTSSRAQNFACLLRQFDRKSCL
jgi:FkbM family methyltransferase